MKTDPRAVIPERKHTDDYCYDCVAISEKEVAPNVWKYGLGIALQVERDVYHMDDDISIDIRPRSSVWKTGMVLSNSTGTVDEGYIGEISAVFYHVMTDMPRYRVGDRVCQMKLGFSERIDFEVVESLAKTDRGTGGYGSTGR